MRRWLLILGAALAASSPAAQAQSSKDVLTPGYLVIRVILDGVGAPLDPMGGGPGAPPVPMGSSGEGSSGGPGFGPPGGPPGFGPMGPGGRSAETAKSIFVVAPYRSITFKPLYPNKAVNAQTNPGSLAAVRTKYGTTYLYQDNTSIQVQPIREPSRGQLQTSLETPIHESHKRWSNNRTFEPIYQMTIDALALGMIDDAFNYANEVMKLVEVLKDKTPSQKILDFTKAWKAVSDKIEKDATPSPEGEEWRSRLSAGSVKNSKHYSLVYWGERQINPAELDRRLAALEKNFKAFYLWHALQGIALTVPDKTLMVVLADRAADVYPLRTKLDGLAIQSDAFYSPTNNLVVLSPERLDNLGAAFADLARSSYKNGWSREELLKGVPATGGQRQPPLEITRMMTLALVDRLLEEEMDGSAMSREATRQLYVASGVLPQNVQLPNWLESGLGSLMQHPKGPLFTHDDKGGHTAMVAGLAHGYGSPNYILHREYKQLEAKHELNPKPEVLLRNILTDRYFEAVRAGADVDPPPVRPKADTSVPVGGSPGGRPGFGPPGSGPPGSQPPPGSEGSSGPGGPGAPGIPGGTITMENEVGNKRMLREKLQMKAEVTSWALMYHLTHDRLLGMQKFYAEIRRMPRDMRLDENFVLMTFCKCFNLMDRQKPNEIDQLAFKDFAEKWVRSMRIVPPYGLDVPIEEHHQQNGGGFGGPGGPGGPGGGPGRPGGPGQP
ncbi:hypothetical protein [Limnoglobus roseus]|uniref:DUF1570 domain-containing protein n=1 Tax=Limnoglobus roseus TaxID=2598579 RepID=A0A5C1AJZ8_9BACT|nr:hypothetical protein [Limnoglobus roseus]QEL18497.1 hypothetical protein PX52LOC_05522 [Limnoglobus roseus]